MGLKKTLCSINALPGLSCEGKMLIVIQLGIIKEQHSAPKFNFNRCCCCLYSKADGHLSHTVHFSLQFWQLHASSQVQMLFSLNFVSTNFQGRCIIRFLSPVEELISIKPFTLLASPDVRKANSFRILSVLVFGNLNS